MEKKFVIVGDIYFSDGFAEILSITEEKMFYDKDTYEKYMDKVEDNGYDYIVLPDYTFPFDSINRGCADEVSRIKTMAQNIGWRS